MGAEPVSCPKWHKITQTPNIDNKKVYVAQAVCVRACDSNDLLWLQNENYCYLNSHNRRGKLENVWMGGAHTKLNDNQATIGYVQ